MRRALALAAIPEDVLIAADSLQVLGVTCVRMKDSYGQRTWRAEYGKRGAGFAIVTVQHDGELWGVSVQCEPRTYVLAAAYGRKSLADAERTCARELAEHRASLARLP